MRRNEGAMGAMKEYFERAIPHRYYSTLIFFVKF